MAVPRRNPPAKWVLPEIVHPAESICFIIEVPKEKFYLAAFRGALLNLCSAMQWGDDKAHTAKEVAKVWRGIYDRVVPCPPDRIIRELISNEENMPTWKEECVDGVYTLSVRTCVCPETYQIIYPLQGVPPSSVPPSGTPAPGDSMQYCINLPANQQIIVGGIVNAGDTITLDSVDGAWLDSVFPWRCAADGGVFFATCTHASAGMIGGDPVPTQNHMTVIIYLDSTPYGIAIGSPFTVPGGVSNAQVSLQANDSNLSDNSGSANVCLTVKNNAVTAWTHIFDFTASPHLDHVSSDGGTAVWTPGVGWQTGVEVISGSTYRYASISINCPSTIHLTRYECDFAWTAGAYTAGTVFETEYYDGVVQHQVIEPSTPTPPTILTTPSTINTSIRTGILCGVSASGDPGGQVTITAIKLTGTGVDPFA